MNVFPLIEKRLKLQTKKDLLQIEIDGINEEIEAMDASTKYITKGFGTEDIFDKTIQEIPGKDGAVIKKSVYVFKYPDTIIPNIVLNTVEVPDVDIDLSELTDNEDNTTEEEII
jgi:hypothetical protein